MYKVEVKITSIRRLTDIRDGKGLYEIIFSEITPMSEEIMSRITPADQPNYSLALPIETNILTLLYKPDNDDAIPFIVGGKYELTVDKKGKLTLSEAGSNE